MLPFAYQQAPGFSTLAIHCLFQLSFWFLFTYAAYQIGKLILKLAFSLKSPSIRSKHNLYPSICLGLGLLILSIPTLVLGAVGELHVEIIRIISLSIVTFGGLSLLSRILKITSKLRLSYRPIPKWTVFVVLLFAIIFIPLALLPTNDWDDLSYQITAVYSYFSLHSFWGLSDIPPYNFPMFAQTLYAYPLAFGFEAIPKLINLSLLVFCFWSIFSISTVLASRLAAIFAVLFFAINNIIFNIAITARSDLIGTFYLSTSLLSYIIWTKNRQAPYFYLSCLLSGVPLAVKYTNLPIVLAVGLGLFLGVKNPRINRAQLLFGAILFILPSSFWYAKNAYYFGQPLYPISFSAGGNSDVTHPIIHRATPFTETKEGPVSTFMLFEQLQSSPTLEEISNSSKIPSIKSMALSLIRSAKNPIPQQSFANPYSLIFNQNAFHRLVHQRIHVLSFLAFLFPFFLNRKYRIISVTIAASLLASLFLSTHINKLRYLLPILPFLSIGLGLACAEGLHLISFKYSSPYIKHLLAWALILILGSLSISSAKSTIEPWWESTYFSGKESYLDFIANNKRSSSYNSIIPFVRQLNLSEPNQTKILLIGSSHGRLFAVPTTGDYEQLGRYGNSWLTLFVESQIQNQDIISKLKDLGFSHILIRWDYFKWVLRNSEVKNMNRTKSSLASLLHVIDRCKLPLESHKQIWLVSLKNVENCK